jgi:hypothetical protein
MNVTPLRFFQWPSLESIFAASRAMRTDTRRSRRGITSGTCLNSKLAHRSHVLTMQEQSRVIEDMRLKATIPVTLYYASTVLRLIQVFMPGTSRTLRHTCCPTRRSQEYVKGTFFR